MLRPMFVCTAAVSASYWDERWAYVEISFHLCSRLRQIVCEGAARNAATGSQRVQCAPLPSHALFGAEVHHLRQRQPSWVTLTAHDLLLTFPKCRLKKKTKPPKTPALMFSIWGSQFLRPFIVISKTTSTKVPLTLLESRLHGTPCRWQCQQCHRLG